MLKIDIYNCIDLEVLLHFVPLDDSYFYLNETIINCLDHDEKSRKKDSDFLSGRWLDSLKLKFVQDFYLIITDNCYYLRAKKIITKHTVNLNKFSGLANFIMQQENKNNITILKKGFSVLINKTNAR